MPDRIIGVTVLPEFLQCEGVDAVLDNLVMKAGVNAVTTSPYVMEPADEATGPADRLVDESPELARIVGASVQGRVALGQRAPARVRSSRTVWLNRRPSQNKRRHR